MICERCAEAADRGLPRENHCEDPGCTCGHQVRPKEK